MMIREQGGRYTSRVSVEYMRLCMRLMDIGLVALASVVAYIYRHQAWEFPLAYAAITLLGVVVFGIITQRAGLYKTLYIRAIFAPLGIITGAMLGVLLLCTVLMFAFKVSEDFSRVWLALWVVGAVFLVSLLHIGVAIWARRPRQGSLFSTRIVLVGEEARIRQCLASLQGDAIQVMAAVVLDNATIRTLKGVTCLATPTTLISYVHMCGVDDIVVCMDMKSYEKADGIMAKLRQAPCAVRYYLPDVFSRNGVAAVVWGIPLLTVYKKPLQGYDILVKRGADIAVSCGLLAVTFPLWLACIVAIKLTSKGPVFYVQKRYGFGGEIISMLKFRSMFVGQAGEISPRQVTKHDTRVTPVGRILRRTSLDELPQLLNVIRGDMSMVGPRPHAMSEHKKYVKELEDYAVRHKVKPGLTGWAQVQGWRGETDTLDKMKARVKHDLEYIENWNFWFDIKIMALTPLVLAHKNAY